MLTKGVLLCAGWASRARRKASGWSSPPARLFFLERLLRSLSLVLQDREGAALCCGACPLYWDERGDHAEITEHLAPTSALSKVVWQAKRRWLGQVRGVGVR